MIGIIIAYDKLGNGCKVDFPVRLESRIKWSGLVLIVAVVYNNVFTK